MEGSDNQLTTLELVEQLWGLLEEPWNKIAWLEKVGSSALFKVEVDPEILRPIRSIRNLILGSWDNLNLPTQMSCQQFMERLLELDECTSQMSWPAETKEKLRNYVQSLLDEERGTGESSSSSPSMGIMSTQSTIVRTPTGMASSTITITS